MWPCNYGCPINKSWAHGVWKIQVLNKVLDEENTGEFRLDDDNVFEWLYATGDSGTYVISDSESNDGSDEQEENINLALGQISNKFVW